jgi:hypothetical protein
MSYFIITSLKILVFWLKVSEPSSYSFRYYLMLYGNGSAEIEQHTYVVT